MPGNYDASTIDPQGADAAHVFRYLIARGFINPGEVVLDVACGYGYGSNLLAMVAESVFGIDVDEKVIETAQVRYPEENLCFRCIDLDRDAEYLSDISVDASVTIETIEHLENPKDFAEMLKKITNRVIVVSAPVIPTVGKNPFHKQDFTEKTLIDLFVDDNWRLFHHFVQGGTYGMFIFYRKKNG